MLKLKPLLSSLYTRIFYNSNKLYSKNGEQLETVLSVSDCLGAQTLTTGTNAGCSKINKNSDVKSKGVPKNNTKKGKIVKCDDLKAMKPQDRGTHGGYITDKCDIFDIPKANSKKWRRISYAALTFLLGLSVFVIANKDKCPKREFIPYEYLYRRTKRFPWRDGKTSLFHGPNNFIPDAEEKRIDRDGTSNPRYKMQIDPDEENKSRVQHAAEGLERRKERHQREQNEKEQVQNQKTP